MSATTTTNLRNSCRSVPKWISELGSYLALDRDLDPRALDQDGNPTGPRPRHEHIIVRLTNTFARFGAVKFVEWLWKGNEKGSVEYRANPFPTDVTLEEEETAIRAALDWANVGLNHPPHPYSNLTMVNEAQLLAEWRNWRREALGRLRQIEGEPISKMESILFVSDGVYKIGDGVPFAVEECYDDILQAFLNKPAMNKQQLVDESGRRNAPRLLKRLTQRYGGIFAPYIFLPGKRSNLGYRVSIRRA